MENKVTVSKKIDETNLASYWCNNINERWDMAFPQNKVSEFYRVIFSSIATMLKYNRSKSNPKIGFKLLNESGEFRLGAILEYQTPEDGEDDTGNWVLSFTFYEDDMKDLDTCYDNMNDSFYTIADHEIFSTMYGHFATNQDITLLFTSAIEALKDQLASFSDAEGAEVELVLPGVFEASVGFEDGNKVFAIVPGANIKQFIKDDKGLAK